MDESCLRRIYGGLQINGLEADPGDPNLMPLALMRITDSEERAEFGRKLSPMDLARFPLFPDFAQAALLRCLHASQRHSDLVALLRKYWRRPLGPEASVAALEIARSLKEVRGRKVESWALKQLRTRPFGSSAAYVIVGDYLLSNEPLETVLDWARMFYRDFPEDWRCSELFARARFLHGQLDVARTDAQHAAKLSSGEPRVKALLQAIEGELMRVSAQTTLASACQSSLLAG
jgi:hypothetical protein